MGTYFDPTSPHYSENPHAYLAELRATVPVHQHPDGSWIVLEYDAVKQVLIDAKLSKQEAYAMGTPRNQRVQAAGASREQLTRKGIAGTDKPEHTELRRMLAWPLTPRAVSGMEEDARRIVDDAIGRHVPGTVFNLNEEIGYPLAFRLLCQILGIPATDDPSEFGQLQRWMWDSVNINDVFQGTAQLSARIASAKEFAGYMGELLERKRSRAGRDLTSSLLAARDEGRLDDSQVLGQMITLVHAGMHTTVAQAGLSVLALLRHRSQWDLLANQPELLGSAIEELLRFDGTNQYMIRTTPSDYRLGEVTIPAGCHVLAFLPSANRDPKKWGPTADQLDIRRPKAKEHLAFGSGIHLCLGAWLARLELRLILGQLTAEFPQTTLAVAEPEWQSTAFIRGMSELPLQLA